LFHEFFASRVKALNFTAAAIMHPDGAIEEKIDTGATVDLLLTDIVMPGKLDGCALAQEFVARRPGGKVVLTSGFPSSRLGDIEGLDAHLRLLDKPYRKQDLARVLRETFAGPAPSPSLAVSLTGC